MRGTRIPYAMPPPRPKASFDPRCRPTLVAHGRGSGAYREVPLYVPAQTVGSLEQMVPAAAQPPSQVASISSVATPRTPHPWPRWVGRRRRLPAACFMAHTSRVPRALQPCSAPPRLLVRLVCQRRSRNAARQHSTHPKPALLVISCPDTISSLDCAASCHLATSSSRLVAEGPPMRVCVPAITCACTCTCIGGCNPGMGSARVRG